MLDSFIIKSLSGNNLTTLQCCYYVNLSVKLVNPFLFFNSLDGYKKNSKGVGGYPPGGSLDLCTLTEENRGGSVALEAA
jgi:hypothetical protein